MAIRSRPSAKSWEQLRREHEEDYSRLFSRMTLSLEGAEAAMPDTWRCPRCKRKKEKFVPVEE